MQSQKIEPNLHRDPEEGFYAQRRTRFAVCGAEGSSEPERGLCAGSRGSAQGSGGKRGSMSQSGGRQGARGVGVGTGFDGEQGVIERAHSDSGRGARGFGGEGEDALASGLRTGGTGWLGDGLKEVLQPLNGGLRFLNAELATGRRWLEAGRGGLQEKGGLNSLAGSSPLGVRIHILIIGKDTSRDWASFKLSPSVILIDS
jgi:hypothetical protein